jgi:trigger factor
MSTPTLSTRVETLSPIRRRVHYAIPASRVASALDAAATRLAARVQVRGFRPGKVPLSLVEKMYAAEVKAGAADKLLDQTVFQALDAAGIQPAGTPELDAMGEIKRGADLDVSVAVEVYPQIALGDWKGAALQCDAVEPDDADVDVEVARRQSDRSEWMPVADAIQKGDEVVLDFEVRPALVGSAQPDEATKRRAVVGEGHLPAAVDEALIGTVPGDPVERTAEGTAETGPLHVRFTVHEANRLVPPTLDDEFAKDLGFPDLAALRADAAEAVAKKARQVARESQVAVAVQHLAAQVAFEVPQAVVDRLADATVRNMFGSMRGNKQLVERLVRQLRPSMRKEAERTLRTSLLIDEVAKTEGLAADDAEVATKISELLENAPAARRGELQRDYETDAGRRAVTEQIRTEKARDAIVAAATWTVGRTLTLRDALAAGHTRALQQRDGEDARSPEHGETDHVHDENCDHDHDHAAHP